MVTKAPITTPVVGWSEMKLYLRLDDDSFKSEVESLVAAATEYFEALTESTIAPRAVTATVSSRERFWELPAGPVASITSVVDATGATLSGWIARYGYCAGLSFPAAANASTELVTVSYQAGYSTVPLPLRVAIKQLARHWWENPEITSDKASTELPFNATHIIKLYKRNLNVY